MKERRHAEFFEVVGSSLAIETPEQFCAWTQGDLQYIFPHEMLVCGVGLIDNSNAHIQQLLTCNFPAEYIQNLHKSGGLNSCPVLMQWIQTRRPVLFELSAGLYQSEWLEKVKHSGLQNIAAHGQCDLNSQAASYFNFCNISGKLTSRHAALIELLVPHLHVALVRALLGAKNISRKPKSGLNGLTEREQEILKWLSSGKTNREIAQVLNISEYTVKNHVQSILIKLKVNTREQAVAMETLIKSMS